MGSSFGTLLRVTTFGESHGPAVGCVVDGCPPRIPLVVEDLARSLRRRKPGQSDLTTPRREDDEPRILSGVHEGMTTGHPIAVLVENRDQRPEDYAELAALYRPGHADFTHDAKYGHRDPRGGGRASARETVGRVAAGAIARRVLERVGVQVVAWVDAVGPIELPAGEVCSLRVTEAEVDAHPTRCPANGWNARMADAIREAQGDGDGLGGVVACVVRGLPPGLGDPVFDRLEADLAKAMLSIPATRAFGIGSGHHASRHRSSESNGSLRPGRQPGQVEVWGQDGGTLGGISTGMPFVFRTTFKPPSTIPLAQTTVDRHGCPATLAARGRHDPCVVPRAVPIVEAMTWLVLADHWLRHEAQCGWTTVRGGSSGDARVSAGLAP